jgi:hypothetical protein
MQDDLGDAGSRMANQRFRDQVEREKSSDPAYAYAPRWVPSGNWQVSLGDVIVAVIGIGILLMACGMKLLGYF